MCPIGLSLNRFLRSLRNSFLNACYNHGAVAQIIPEPAMPYYLSPPTDTPISIFIQLTSPRANIFATAATAVAVAVAGSAVGTEFVVVSSALG